MLDFENLKKSREEALARTVRDWAEGAMLLENLGKKGLDKSINAVVEENGLSKEIVAFPYGKGFFLRVYQTQGFAEYAPLTALLEDTFGACYATADRPSQEYREYCFGDPRGFFCELALYLSSTAQHCTRVQIGTKIEEVPVYAFHCHDDGTPVEDPQ